MAQEYENFRAVLLGAGEWPGLKTTKASGVFERSKNAFKSYLVDTLGMQPGLQILDLFGSQDSPTDIDRSIRKFLHEHTEDDELKFTHLIVYYTGHGGFTDRDHQFQLMLPYTTDEQRNSSGYKVSMIAETINDMARQATKLVILDCCFAAGAMPEMMRQSEGGLDEKIDAEARAYFPPASGTALLAASNQKQWALAEDKDGMMTMFSSGLVSALNEGDEDFDPLLSLADVEKLCTTHIADTYLDEAVIPQLYVPQGLRAEIAEVALLPNPARKPPSVEDRLDALEAKFDGVVSSLRSQTSEISGKFDTLNERFDQTALPQVASADTQSSTETNYGGPWSTYRMSRPDWNLLEFSLRQYLIRHFQSRRLGNYIMIMGVMFLFVNAALSGMAPGVELKRGSASLWLDILSATTAIFAFVAVAVYLLGVIVHSDQSNKADLIGQLSADDQLRLDRLDHSVTRALMHPYFDIFGLPVRLPYWAAAGACLSLAVALNAATFDFYGETWRRLWEPSVTLEDLMNDQPQQGG